MKSLQIATVLVLAISLITVAERDTDVITDYKPYHVTWEAFKMKFDRQYSWEEENERYNVFVANIKEIEAHNQRYLAGAESFDMGINHFTDRKDNERIHNCHVDEDDDGSRLYKRQTGYCALFSLPSNYAPPSSLDWRTSGVVTPVKDQGNCGSCYAFGVTTTIAAQVKFSTGKLVPLSQQQLVDCRNPPSCGGSTAEKSFQLINSTGGIMSDKDYPYRSQTFRLGQPGANCDFQKTKVQAHVSGCQYSLSDETKLKYMVSHEGPIYVSIVVVKSFVDYKSGVYSVSRCNQASSLGRHCVTVIGYGRDSIRKKDFWIIKNSWGTNWGEKGYGKIERGKNMCGIADRVTVPVVGGITGRGAAATTTDLAPSSSADRCLTITTTITSVLLFFLSVLLLTV